MAAILSGVTPLLQVFDMPAAVRFYRDVLGFEVLSHSPLIRGNQGEYFHWAMLRLRPFPCSGGNCARGAGNHWLWHEALHYF